ncbi:unannotated protein [freshwater metagenome]|uniref:Unannotated protein n=1 Tax=freshwater metagenome TaxID=449393 RepID=A0A6J6M7G5_9ZZZZ
MRTRVSSDIGLWSLGSGRKDLAANSQLFAKIESSPRLEVMISPVTLTMSPKSISDFHALSESSPTLSSENIAWSSVPSPSRKVAKQSLPVSRLKIMRPVKDWMSPVVTSISRDAYFARTSASESVRATPTGYGSIPRSIRPARFSRRIRNCSGRSSSLSIIGLSAIMRGVYRVKHFSRESNADQSRLDLARDVECSEKYQELKEQDPR